MMSGRGLNVDSILITGTDRGIGLEFVKQLTQLPRPPKHIFATCLHRDTEVDTIANTMRGCWYRISFNISPRFVLEQCRQTPGLY